MTVGELQPSVMRRRQILWLAGAGLTRALVAPGAAQTQPLAVAADFVRDTGSQFASLASQGGAVQDKRRRLRSLIDRVVDVDAAARFCLGRFWRLASPEQQRDYVELFHQALLNSIASKLGDYPDGSTRVTISRAVQTGRGIEVPTLVERPNNPPANVVWIVSMEAGRPQIIDLLAEGMSLRLTQRDDYAAFLTRNNGDVGALIKALRQQALSPQD